MTEKLEGKVAVIIPGRRQKELDDAVKEIGATFPAFKETLPN